MAATSLPSPGVSVVQVFKSVSPTIITPTLVPCVVGVCKQVVDVLSTSASGSSSLNPQALITLPGFFLALAATGSPPVYGGLDGLKLVLSINNAPAVTTTFVGDSLAPSSTAAQIQAAFTDAGVTAAVAEVTPDGTTFRVRTIGTGEFQTITVEGGAGGTDPAVAAAFGIIDGYIYPGRSAYDQFEVDLLPSNLPDPRNNLAQLAIEFDTVRVFLALGNGAELKELLRTESFLRSGGAATTAVLTGSVDLTGLSYSTGATVTGTTDVTAGGLYGGGGTLAGETLVLNVNAAGVTTLTFDGSTNTANEAALLAAIHTQWPALTATVGGSGGTKLILTDSVLGTPSTIVIDPSSTSLTNLGLTASTHTGTNGVITTQTAVFSINGGANETVTFAYPGNEAAILSQINAVINPGAVATAPATDLVITTVLTGAAASVKAVSGSALTSLGLTSGQMAVGINGAAAIDDGNGDALTPLISLNGANFSTAGGHAVMTGTIDLTTLTYPSGIQGRTLTLSDGHIAQTLTFDSTITTDSLLVAAITAFWPNITATIGGSNHLVLTEAGLGDESVVKALAGSALSVLGLTAGAVARGLPFPPLAGDKLYVDGAFVGNITQVTPGGQNSVLKIDKQVPINAALGSTYYIIAENLTGAATSTRPSSDLIVNLLDTVIIKSDILRDTTGAAIPSGRAQVYVSYKAVREDVTSIAKNPGLLRFESTADLDTQLSPVTTDNPLALGLFFALLNAPNNQVTGLGVDEVSADSPFGTVEGFTRAAEYLEGFEVYGIAPLTHEATVGQIFLSHVLAMSEPTAKGERIVLFNPSRPAHKIDTLVASGTDGNSATSTTFDTGVVNLAQLVLNSGVSPVGTIPADSGVFLDIAADDKNYSISQISGSVVTIRTSFASGENDDGFYSTTDLATPPLPATLIEEAFAVRIRGVALVLPDGVTPDRDSIAATYQSLGQSIANRRYWQTAPDSCAATISGIEQQLDGFYLNAATVGLIGAQPPQQSFTNYPVTGFTKVIGSNDFFTNKQMDIMAAGGNYIFVQPAANGPISSRFALTTDLTSVETRTDSITKIVDFVAKFLRTGLKNFIGRFNITQGFLDTLSHVIHGLLAYLQDTGTLIGFSVDKIIQDEDNPDTVLVSVTLDVPFPCNYLNIVISI